MTNGAQPRSHIFSGLLLILIGGVFLLSRFDPALGIGHLFRVYWPVLLILWGVAKLIDYVAAQSAGRSRPPLLTGGEAALLILIAFIASGFVFHDWIRDRYPDFDFEMPPFHQSYTQTRDLPPQTIPAGAHVDIETGRGDIVVTGSDGPALSVHAVESASGRSESAARDLMKGVDVVLEQTAGVYRVHPVQQDHSRWAVGVELNVIVPKTASVTASSSHGDIRITGIGGNVEIRSQSGDVEVRDAGSDVAIEMQKGDAQIARVAGNLRITGRANLLDVANVSMDISDVSGDATLDGPFIGTLRMRNVAKAIQCTTPWATLATNKLAGRIEVDAGDMSISDFGGPTRITARAKDINLQNAAGGLDVSNRYGDISVSYAAPPREEINITSDSGNINLTLPSKSSFEISAVSRSGDVESDFQNASLKPSRDGETSRFIGKFGAVGPTISIATNYGTIRLRKSP